MANLDWTASFFDRSYVELLAAQKDPRTTTEEVDFVLEALAIEPPARILDVACGFGRHSIALARRGFEVLGVDNSPEMLAEARRRAKRIHRVRFERRDMRRLSLTAEFDAVINMFTSFGYFSHRDNLAALRAMARALRPRGRILIETIDRRALRRQLARNSTNRLWWPVSADHYILEEIRLDSTRGVLHSDWLILQQRGQRWSLTPKRIRLRLYDSTEWRELFDATGLRRLAVHRGHGKAPGEKIATARRVLVAQRRIPRRHR
jgi:SAM-dependent methyltransferase